MPNHVMNRITFECDDKEKLNKFLDSIMTKDELDFCKIIPQPEKREDCPNEYIVTPNSHIMPDENKPWFDWYKWQVDNWGTKWNSYSNKREDNILEFETAWSPPIPVIDRLAEMCKFNKIDFEYLWSEEQLSVYGGFARLNGDEYYSCNYESGSDDMRELAKELWGYYSWDEE